MRISTGSKNILTAAVAALVFAAFVVLATRGGNDDAKNRLNALENATTTTLRQPAITTTTEPLVETTTTEPVTATTSAPAPTPTTRRATTGTTAKRTTTTRRSSTATTASRSVPPPHNGVGTEASDNQYSFTMPSGPTSPEPTASASDPFSFTIKATPTGAGGVHFTIQLQNHTSRTISFPGGLRIIVTVSQAGSADQTYSLASSTFTSMAPGERDTVQSDGVVVGSGSFVASATCDVDYGS